DAGRAAPAPRLRQTDCRLRAPGSWRQDAGREVSAAAGATRQACIPWQGLRNMVSCHYVLKGAFHLRHYDRLEDDATHMVIEPTVDQLVRAGSHSAISDEKNNVHWLIAESDEAFTYDVLIADLAGKKYEIDNIDPDTAEKVAGDRVRVRKLPV